tara:strand:- start:80 stop:262 length:183 start_codon:yes stop_codon:yes gene_type:complete
MAKKKSKAKTEEVKGGSDLARLKVLKEKLNEIASRWHAMTPEEQKIVAEAKEEINKINNK